MKQMDWPGNIRELQNIVERVALLSTDEQITASDIERLTISKGRNKNQLGLTIDNTESFHEYKEEAEKLFLLKKLEKYDWNISSTADAIGIQRSHIYTKMKKYGIER